MGSSFCGEQNSQAAASTGELLEPALAREHTLRSWTSRTRTRPRGLPLHREGKMAEQKVVGGVQLGKSHYAKAFVSQIQARLRRHFDGSGSAWLQQACLQGDVVCQLSPNTVLLDDGTGICQLEI